MSLNFDLRSLQNYLKLYHLSKPKSTRAKQLYKHYAMSMLIQGFDEINSIKIERMLLGKLYQFLWVNSGVYWYGGAFYYASLILGI